MQSIEKVGRFPLCRFDDCSCVLWCRVHQVRVRNLLSDGDEGTRTGKLLGVGKGCVERALGRCYVGELHDVEG